MEQYFIPYQDSHVFLELITGRKEGILPDTVFEQDTILLRGWEICDEQASILNE